MPKRKSQRTGSVRPVLLTKTALSDLGRSIKGNTDLSNAHRFLLPPMRTRFQVDIWWDDEKGEFVARARNVFLELVRDKTLSKLLKKVEQEAIAKMDKIPLDWEAKK